MSVQTPPIKLLSNKYDYYLFFLIILIKYGSEKLFMPKLVKKHVIINGMRVLTIMMNHQATMA